MKCGVYARDAFPGGQAFVDGLLGIGHNADLRSAPDWGVGCVEPFDAVALYSLQGKGQTIFDEYRAAGVPVFVIDYGYLRRANHAHDWKTGHWQVSLNGLGVIPAFDCPPDRFDALGLEVKAKGGDPKGYTLLCVQTPDDKSHGMSRDQLRVWCHEQAEQYPDLVIRPHPLFDEDYGLPRCEAESLDDALAGARLVVTANSNVGHDALLAGVPVIGTLPAPWSDLAGESVPSVAARQAYFNRVAYGQWTWDEMRTGAPQAFLVDQVLPGSGEGVVVADIDPAIQPPGAADLRAADGKIPEAQERALLIDELTERGIVFDEGMGLDELRSLTITPSEAPKRRGRKPKTEG